MGVCLITWTECFFTGDALFIRGCGRTDFQEGDPHTLFKVFETFSFLTQMKLLSIQGMTTKASALARLVKKKIQPKAEA